MDPLVQNSLEGSLRIDYVSEIHYMYLGIIKYIWPFNVATPFDQAAIPLLGLRSRSRTPNSLCAGRTDVLFTE